MDQILLLWAPSDLRPRSFLSFLPPSTLSPAAVAAPFLFVASLFNKLYGHYPSLSLLLSLSRLFLQKHQIQFLRCSSLSMEKTNKRPAKEIDDGEAVLKKPRPPVMDDGVEDDDIFAWLLMEEDDSEVELLNLLDLEKDASEAPSTVGRVRFIDNPYSSLLVFQSSSSYITINGNEESCGSSFSDSDTSVMASVDMSGLKVRGKLLGLEEKGTWATREEGWVCGDGVNGCDWDDEVLARFLGENHH